MHLEQFNATGRTEAADALRPCLDIRRWIDEVADARPYATIEALLDAGRGAANPFTPAEIDAALAHHPRIGERAAGNSTEARLSQSEQAGLGEADAAVAEALAEGNRAYEEKFGQVFLIRAAGRQPRGNPGRAQHPARPHPRRGTSNHWPAAAGNRSAPTRRTDRQMSMSHVTTHVLDTGSGKPAADVPVTLHMLDGERWVQIAEGTTDADGRIKQLGPDRLPTGPTAWPSTRASTSPPAAPTRSSRK